jgi:hypothetical protein
MYGEDILRVNYLEIYLKKQPGYITPPGITPRKGKKSGRVATRDEHLGLTSFREDNFNDKNRK